MTDFTGTVKGGGCANGGKYGKKSIKSRKRKGGRGKGETKGNQLVPPG